MEPWQGVKEEPLSRYRPESLGPDLPQFGETLWDWEDRHFAILNASYKRWREGSDDRCALPAVRDDDEVERISRAMARCGCAVPRIQRYLDCGSRLDLFRMSDSSRCVIRGCRCMDRFCSTCRARLGKAIAVRMRRYSDQCKHRICFLTLTQLPEEGEDLSACLARHRAAFARLRMTELWKRGIHGAMGVYEVTRNDREGWWHVHLHLIVDASYLGFDNVVREWRAARRYDGPGSGVDLSVPKWPEKVVQYLAKYLSQGISPEQVDDEELVVDLIAGFGGRKLVNFYGAWRGKGGLRTEDTGCKGRRDEVYNCGWEHIGELTTLIACARFGDRKSSAVLRSIGFWPLVRRQPLLLEGSVCNVRVQTGDGARAGAKQYGWDWFVERCNSPPRRAGEAVGCA